MKTIMGDALEIIKNFEPNSIDSLVTDPPAGISFMGKAWDKDKGGRQEWVSWMTQIMKEAHRTLKPGAHGLVWALPRTSHWTATALEDAGFEIRDVITHLFGQGFPKSLDVSKAIDKAAGIERRVVGKYSSPEGTTGMASKNDSYGFGVGDMNNRLITTSATVEGRQWEGWGTALKPASEHWILVRKPCSEKTVAKNVLKWGTGGINIDGSRIGTDTTRGNRYNNRPPGGQEKTFKGLKQDEPWNVKPGRFPANLILSHSIYCTDNQCDLECAIKRLNDESGFLHASGNKTDLAIGRDKTYKASGYHISYSGRAHRDYGLTGGGASRFFYCAKISPSERNEGVISTDKKVRSEARPNSPDLTEKFPDHDNRIRFGNNHPTVKPKKLMKYLINLITPPSGIVLDPFMGSGSTGVAAKELGFNFIGIEKEEEYYAIAKQRLSVSCL